MKVIKSGHWHDRDKNHEELLFGFPSSLRLAFCMREDQFRFMSLLGQLPARLTVEQTAWVLNCQPHDIPVLIASRLLRPLGNPPANGIKFFATEELLESVKNRTWLAKVTTTVSQHWQRKNQRKKDRSTENSYPLQLLPAAG